jgi:hypothetical protein
MMAMPNGDEPLKRQCAENTGAPDYPTFDEFRTNRRDFLKSFGMGVAGLALASCESPEPEPPALGGVPALPNPPGHAYVEDSPPLPGAPAKPEQPGKETCPSGNKSSTPPKSLDDPPPLGGKPAPPRLLGEMPVPVPPESGSR